MSNTSGQVYVLQTMHAASADLEHAEGASRCPSPLRRAPRIEDTRSALGREVLGLVRVPEHHQVGLGEPARQPLGTSGARAGVVHERDVHAVEVHGQLEREDVCESDVVVAEDGTYGRQLAEAVEELAARHVAGVENDVGAGRGREHTGIERPVVAVAQVGVGEEQGAHADSVPGAAGAARRRQ